MRLLSVVRNDVRLQLRHGFYAAYAVVSLAYWVLLGAVGEGSREVLLPIVVFSDPAVYGFVFVGGIMLLERGDGTLSSLFVTPVRPAEYLASKVLSLALLALLASGAVALLGGGVRHDWALLALGVGLTSCLFVLLGVAAASRFRTFNGFVLGAGSCTALFFLPLLDFLGVWRSPLLCLLPTWGSLQLIGSALGWEAARRGSLLPALLALGVWIAVAWVWAWRWFHRFVLYREAP